MRVFRAAAVFCEAKRATGLINIHSWMLLLTTQSAFWVSLFSVSRELYGWTTTSLISSWFGKTEYVCTSFFGYLKIRNVFIYIYILFIRKLQLISDHSGKSHVCLRTCHWVSPVDRIPVLSPCPQQWNDTGQIPTKTKSYLLLAVPNLQLQHVPRVYKAHCKLYWCRKLNVCGWANASLSSAVI